MNNHIIESLNKFDEIFNDLIIFAEKILNQKLSNFQKDIFRVLLHQISNYGLWRTNNKFHEYRFILMMYVQCASEKEGLNG